MNKPKCWVCETELEPVIEVHDWGLAGLWRCPAPITFHEAVMGIPAAWRSANIGATIAALRAAKGN